MGKVGSGRGLVLAAFLTVLSLSPVVFYFYEEHREEEKFKQAVETVLNDKEMLGRYISPVVDCVKEKVSKRIDRESRYVQQERSEFYNLSDIVDVRPYVYGCTMKIVERNKDRIEKDLGTQDRTFAAKVIGSISYGYVSKRLVVFDSRKQTLKIL